MPFNFFEPKPLEEYDHPHGRRRRYWPYPKFLEHLDYTPDEVRSWGSIGHRGDIHHLPPHHEEIKKRKKCTIKCKDIKPVNHYFPEIYIRDRLTLENPGLLPALKNTVRVRDVPDKPITFVPPRFVHTNQRSQYHLLVREKDRTALCEIARNLQQREDKRLDMMRASHIGRKMLLRAHASQSAASHKKVKSTKSVNKAGEGKGTRKNLEGFFDSKIQLPTPTQIPKDVTQYIWSEEGGMESLCKTYPGKSLFVESPSNLPLAQHPEFADMMLDGPLMNARKTHAFVNQAHPVVGNIKKPSVPARQNAKDPIASKAYAEFNHYGLLEAAKNVALEHILKQLYRREPHVAVPKELLGTYYGALKGAPVGFKNEKAQIPHHLHENCYPEPEEMEKVERAIQFEKNLRKTRKARGMQSQVDVTSYLAQFTKPIITESWEDVTVRAYKKYSAETETPLEKHDSSESLIYKVAAVMVEGEPPIEPPVLDSSTEIIMPIEEEIPVIPEEPEVIRKSLGQPVDEEEMDEEDEEEEGDSEEEGEEELEAIESLEVEEREEESTGSGELEDIDEYVDEVPSQFTLERLQELEAEEELDDLSEFRDGGSLVVQDSSESLPYPDVTFSMVALPLEATGVEKLGLYKRLAEDDQSVSSEDEEEEEEVEEEEVKVTTDDFFFDDDDFFDDDEEEEEEEDVNEDDAPMVQVKSDTSMLLDNMFTKTINFLDRRGSHSHRVTISRDSTTTGQ